MYRFWHSHGLVRPALCFSIGIILFEIFNYRNNPILITGLLFSSLGLAVSFFMRKTLSFSVCLWLSFLGLGYFHCSNYLSDSREEHFLNHRGKIKRFILEAGVPERTKSDYYKYIGKILAVDTGKWISSSGKALIFLKDSSNSSPAQFCKLLVNKSLFEIENNGNPGTFQYASFLKKKDIYAQCFITSHDYNILEEHDPTIGHLLTNIRNHLKTKLESHIQNPEASALYTAMLLGDKSDLNPELRESFSKSGAMHVLAVSGLHVGILIGVINWFLVPMKKSKKLRFLKLLIEISILWLFAALTNFSPSVTRAGIMFSALLIGQSIKRPGSIFNSLAMAGLIMLIINPMNLFSVGFQLSFSAVIGIVSIFPLLYPLLNFQNAVFNKLWALTTVSIGAQLFTLPFTLYYFGQFPNYFILSNWVAIPAALLMVSGGLILAISPFELLSELLGKALAAIGKVVFFLLDSIASMPYSTTSDISLQPTQVILLSLFVLFSTLILAKNQVKLALGLACCFFTITLLELNEHRIFNRRKELLFYQHHKKSAFSIIDGFNEKYFFEKGLGPSSKDFKFNIQPHIRILDITNIEYSEPLRSNCLIEWKDSRILYIKNWEFDISVKDCDIALISPTLKFIQTDKIKELAPKYIVHQNNWFEKFISENKEHWAQEIINVNLAKHGAFKLSLNYE